MSEFETIKRKQLLDAGRDLCHRQGLLLLSAERVAAEAHVSKRTLYKYFKDRQRFIAAIVDHDADQWREWFFNAVSERKAQSGAVLYSFYEVLNLWISSDDFQGVLFARAVLAYQKKMPGCVARVVGRHVGLLRDFLDASIPAAHAKKSRQSRERLLFLVLSILAGSFTSIPGDKAQGDGKMARAVLALLRGEIDRFHEPRTARKSTTR